jgi:hypothetical protein
MFAILKTVLLSLLPFLGKFVDKSFDALGYLAPIVVRYATKWAKVSLWVFGVTFVLNLSSTLLAFTFYHLGMAIVIALASYCTIFTVTTVLNGVLAVIVLAIAMIVVPLIG